MYSNSGIYKITCLINSMVYVGYSIDLIFRKSKYENINIKTQPLIKESIIRHGWLNHKFEIIEHCGKELLKIREKYWIKELNTFNNGLNKNRGGGGPIQHSEKTKQKMKKPKPIGFGEIISNLKKGKHNPKLSQSLKGKPSNFKNHTHTEESKIKMKLSKINHPMFNDTLKQKRSLSRKGKNIECNSLNKNFSSIKQASIETGISERSISNILTGRAIKTKNGLIFTYVN